MSRSNWSGRNRFVTALLAPLVLASCGPRMAPAGVEVVARRPPGARVEVRGVAPGPGYLWVAGHFTWRTSEYVWIAGHWERPPRAGLRRWEPGHWQRVRGGWYWVEGQWR